MAKRVPAYWTMIAVILAIHGALLAYGAARNAPTWDEGPHLVAGMSHWRFGAFGLYRVNPPLVRLVAAIPALCAEPKVDWRRYDAGVGIRSECAVFEDFMRRNGDAVFAYITLARWACIPFSLLGAGVCCLWARQLYGPAAGVAALVLWCFDPNVLAHAGLITPDIGGAAFACAAAYAFWRWLKAPSWRAALLAGLAMGFAESAKTTCLVLPAILPLVWVACRVRTERVAWAVQSVQLALVLLIAVCVLNAGYGFDGSFQKLGDYRFVSHAMSGQRYDFGRALEGGNRFSGTWLADVPVPVPKDYLMGIDVQTWDFERPTYSYLAGEWRARGWWYYYLYALAVKAPLGTWVLLFLALAVSLFGKGYSAPWRDESVVLAPVAAVLLLVSSQTGMNHHMRYVLPVFPFAFIWVSKVAQALKFRQTAVAVIAAGGLAWSVASSLWVYPHSLSYFNELAGGPTGGHSHLDNSNIDWGQDLLYLKEWYEAHREARPLGLAYFGSCDPKIAGIEFLPPPHGPSRLDTRRSPTAQSFGPLPGWYAMSIHEILRHGADYEYFLQFEPVAMAGYSIYIYHVTREEADRVRRELGLPEPRDDRFGMKDEG